MVADDLPLDALSSAEGLGEGIAAVLLNAGDRVFVEREHLDLAIVESSLAAQGLTAGERVPNEGRE